LLENPTDPENLRWVDGEVDAFQISVNEEKALSALRPTFDFKSMSSFVRQLSYYDFKRLSDRRKSNERRGELTQIVFTHQSGLFVRGNPAAVEQIKRKLRIRNEKGRRASAVSVGSVDDDYSQTDSPLFSPTATTWPSNDQPPPLPTPPLPYSFGSSSMGSFSLSAPPSNRPLPDTTLTDPQQPRWQPYHQNSQYALPSPDPSFPFPSPSSSAQTTEPQRYAPYPRVQPNSDRRASAVGSSSEATNLSPRTNTIDLAYYAGKPPQPSPSSLVQSDPLIPGSSSFRLPFASPPYSSSSSAQQSHYFPSSRHPSSPGATPLPPQHSQTLPTGLAVAFDQSPSVGPSVSTLSSPVENPYPPLSSLQQYRPTPPVSFRYPFNPPQEQPQDSSTQPHLGFRNHLRFSSVPSQPPYPYPQFTPPRTDEYHSPTSVPDEEMIRRAQLEARRTSYPFPHPPPPNDASYATHTQPSTATTEIRGGVSEWNQKQYFPSEPPQPTPMQSAVPSPSVIGESTGLASWRHEPDQQYRHERDPSLQGAVSTEDHSRGAQSQQLYYGSVGGGMPQYQQHQQ
ncbi:hypothetical protein JCM5353_008191, partial [Sporobolomyces roseus]